MALKRLTARNKNNLAYLVNVKSNEQDIESPYPNTLKCLMECFERLAFYEDEADKIRMCCAKPCHMGKDIKLIEREYGEGHAPYGAILAQYERQLKECPRICPRYEKVEG